MLGVGVTGHGHVMAPVTAVRDQFTLSEDAQS